MGPMMPVSDGVAYREPMFASVAATAQEVAAPGAGDELVPDADVVMDRGFTVAAPPEEIWPWLVQLGKNRAGWYLPRSVERLVPRSHRAARAIDPRWQQLEVGDVIPDYGGPGASFEVASIDAPSTLVYRSRRGRTALSWAITCRPYGTNSSRIHLRLRMAPVRHRRLAGSVGGAFDLITIAGMAAGLRERLHLR
jgi:hypothetical protein